MQGLQQSYTQYFNRSYRKVGHLFQGRYRAIICDKDKYLLALFATFISIRYGLGWPSGPKAMFTADIAAT
jgi:hypothetical protein